MTDAFLENAFFRNIYCNLASSASPRCAGGGPFGDGMFPAGMEWLAFLITAFVIIFLVVNAALLAVNIYIWGERRLVARLQARLGPNRWGPYGLLTPIADLIKILTKEDIVPAAADRLVFNLAPVLIVVPVLLVFAVIPFASSTWVADLNVGVLYIIAVLSVGSYSAVMAGWGSQNRYAMLGAFRAVALLVSYELPMVLALIGVLMITGSMSLVDVVHDQNVPFALVQPLGFLIFLIGSVAEIQRPPFDLAEAESELIGGYHTDYSGIKWGLFQAGEFMATIASAAIITTLFLSGWRGWGFLPSHIWFLIKLVAVLFAMTWLRGTLPRLRIDQVTAFAWKGLLPLAALNLVVSGVLSFIWPAPGVAELWVMAIVNLAVAAVSIFTLGLLLGPRPGERTTPAGSAVFMPAKREGTA
ncbi:MAG: NADH-quinone oxidoreductase subunit NuoH [Chloroflexi bacterium]|nr:NADH-quinone oxidoreductase subunit NuoH [Chloroflexota bacterium]